ncbi:hypothetical protein RHSIM_Rhsim10G0059300 [Rhododendron simsii]|uniref:Sulfotransferase n=1 Tax=Rhododendron simsii TaxID=118357 RepID=A0A834GB00_RHOSS|nr:hypothetical protein RHSIM_Rhsim10G0059300 [Rhododendron simsii]
MGQEREAAGVLGLSEGSVGQQKWEPQPLEDIVSKFCEGVVVYGPYFEHVLGYHKESLERPEKFFFITYEELKSDPNIHVKKLAEFLGCPFVGKDMEEQVEDVVRSCSSETLKKHEVNNSSVVPSWGIVPYMSWFRQEQDKTQRSQTQKSKLKQIEQKKKMEMEKVKVKEKVEDEEESEQEEEDEEEEEEEGSKEEEKEGVPEEEGPEKEEESSSSSSSSEEDENDDDEMKMKGIKKSCRKRLSALNQEVKLLDEQRKEQNKEIFPNEGATLFDEMVPDVEVDKIINEIVLDILHDQGKPKKKIGNTPSSMTNRVKGVYSRVEKRDSSYIYPEDEKKKKYTKI